MIAVGAVYLAMGCEQSNPKKETGTENPGEKPAIAMIGDQKITLNQMQNEMRHRGGHIPGRFESYESKKAVLDELIYFELLAQKAKRAGYEKDPEIVTALKRLIVEKFKQDYIEKLLHRQKISNLEIQNYYNDHMDRFTSPEMFRAAILTIKYSSKDNLVTKKEKRERAETVRKEALKQRSKTKDFGKLAREYSDDLKTKFRGGAMSWLAKDSKIYHLDQDVAKALFILEKPGDISPVIETKEGLFLIKLMDKRNGQKKRYKSVQNQIRNQLVAEKRQKWLDDYYQEIKKEFTITINKEGLSSIQTPGKFSPSDQRPPGFPLN